MRICVPLLLLLLAPGCVALDKAGQVANATVVQVARGVSTAQPPPPPPRDPQTPPRD